MRALLIDTLNLYIQHVLQVYNMYIHNISHSDRTAPYNNVVNYTIYSKRSQHVVGFNWC